MPGHDDIARLADEIARLRARVEELGSRDDAQRRAFDQLYEEMRQYKEDFVFQAEKPLLIDLLMFYDSLVWFRETMIEGDAAPEVVADTFQYLLDEFLEVLYRRDVVPLDPRERFDRHAQKVVEVVPTDDPDEDWRVHRVVRRGFLRAGRLLRPEEVVVRRLRRGD